MSSHRTRNVLYAFDLTKEGYPSDGNIVRTSARTPSVSLAADSINRGAFHADGKIIFNLLDGHTVAIDAATGKELWVTKIAT